MDIRHFLSGVDFVWDVEKASANAAKHEGVSFEEAATVFFDPLFRRVDASRNNESRDAVIGFSARQRLLFVVHVQIEDAMICIISARKATAQERRDHDHF
jgi:uncharacterized DUF497 family protein